MKWFKVNIKLKAPTGTPWQADTIFGHLCWIITYRDGEAELKRFLKPFIDGNPTFLLSDGFPQGFLPRPLSFKLPDEDTFESFKANRELRKITYLTDDQFKEVIHREAVKLEDIKKESEEFREKIYSRAVLKNQISRLTGTTGEEGNLYGFIEHWMPEVVIYGKVLEGFENELEKLFQNFSQMGYGKRKSVGYGTIEDLEFDDNFNGFPEFVEANGFMTLSGFIPKESDPTEGRWRIRVKYGRLGEELANSGNPFKKPLVMLTPGSVFYDKPLKDYYGQTIKDVSVIDGIVHYAYALPVPLLLPASISKETEKVK